MLATGRVCQGIRTRGTWDNEPGPQNRDILVMPTGDQRGAKCSVLFPLTLACSWRCVFGFVLLLQIC